MATLAQRHIIIDGIIPMCRYCSVRPLVPMGSRASKISTLEGLNYVFYAMDCLSYDASVALTYISVRFPVASKSVALEPELRTRLRIWGVGNYNEAAAV